MKLLTKKEAIKTITGLNLEENTCILQKKSDGDVILYATMEERECGTIENQYHDGRGWEFPAEEFFETLKLTENKLIDAIVECHGYVCGDIYIYGEDEKDEDTINHYLTPENYLCYTGNDGVFHDMYYIYATNDEIVSWLPFLRPDTLYCFIIDKPISDRTVREQIFREKQHEYLLMDTEDAVEEYFDGDEEDESYKKCMDNLETLVGLFEKKEDSETGSYYTWQAAIEEFLEN